MDLETYLRSLDVSEADIQRFRDEKIDCNVISVMSDEELAWFLQRTGDRVLVRNFVKKSITSGQRKEHLMKSVRERLAAIRSKRIADEPSKRKKKRNTSGGPNTKSTRQLYMGWKHREGSRITQVIEKKGGGTKLLSMPKDYKKTGIIELGKKIYFPDGKSSKGAENQFSFELIDSSNRLVPSEKSVLEIIEENSQKIPRIYLQTEKLKVCVGSNNGTKLTHGNGNSDYNKDCMHITDLDSTDGEQLDIKNPDPGADCIESTINVESNEELPFADPVPILVESVTEDEQGVIFYYASTSVSKYSGQTSVTFKDKQQIFDEICRIQGPPDVTYENFNPVDFNYPIARIEVNGLATLNIESQFLQQEEESNVSVDTLVASSSAEHCQLSETLLPVIARKDIKFSEKILGAGSQGIVREGNWLGTQVAVKSFKTGRLTEMELREIHLLARIRHPYIIQIMGVSLENRQTHLIFELVKGDNLGDILFDEEKKNKYKLNNEKKKKLLLQVCQATSYLHGQSNPIIHQDIKPDNILVSENLVVKLCDLGLAKFKTMATQYRTVVGSLKGTVVYMAPEILLSKATATTYSDIWSLGCTILETFTEGDVWPDFEEDFSQVLKEKMKNFEIPNTSSLPPYLQPTVQKCFHYNPMERPNVEELMNCFEAILTDDENASL